MNIVDNSWIKLPRNFVNWSWYHDANMVQLYLYLLLNANVYDVKYNDITIKRGECLVSLNTLSKETGISLKSLRTSLADAKDQEIIFLKGQVQALKETIQMLGGKNSNVDVPMPLQKKNA